MASRELSETTIGVPNELVLNVVLGDPSSDPRVREQIERFVTPTCLSSELVNALVKLVRATDTPDAYHMDKTFERGKNPNRKCNWTATPRYSKEIDRVIARYGVKGNGTEDRHEAYTLSLALHFKRARGLSINPLVPQHDIVFILCSSDRKGTGIGTWFDITSSDDPARHSLAQDVPTRRPSNFVVEDMRDERYPHSCLSCSNRYERRLQTCSKCFVARYCDRYCQRRDWVHHKGHECASFKLAKQRLSNDENDDAQ